MKAHRKLRRVREVPKSKKGVLLLHSEQEEDKEVVGFLHGKESEM